MSHSGKPFHEMSLDSLTDRLQDSLRFEQNKPDFKELDRGSHSATKPSTTSISSHTVSPKRSNETRTTHSGELEKVRSVATTRNSKPGHRRSSSTGAPLIYSGSAPSFYHSSNSSGTSTSSSTSTGGSVGGGSGSNTSTVSSVSSPNSILYPTGNICPSGKILKSNMGSRTSNRTEKLGSGTVNYGHGNIMKGGGKLECNGRGNVQYGGEAGSVVKWAMMSSDPEEVKKGG